MGKQLAADEPSLIGLLGSSELWDSLRELVAKLRGACYPANPAAQALYDFQAFQNWELRTFFQLQVIDRVPRPAPLTADDLVENLRHQLAGISFDGSGWSDEYENAKRRFLLLAADETDERRGESAGSLEIDLGTWSGDEHSRAEALDGWELWDTDCFILNATPQRYLSGLSFKLIGDLVGWCSGGALIAAEKWVSQLAPSVAKTAACCSTHAERPGILAGLLDDDERARKKVIPPEGDPPISFIQNENAPGTRVFRECFYILARAHLNGIDSFTRRLANAVELLSEADRTDSAPVALALCFGAIEAIVCEEPKELDRLLKNVRNKPAPKTTLQLKKYVPALLMPKAGGMARKSRGNVVGTLYRIRSKIIHGERLACEKMVLHDIRQTAAAVLRSAIQWRSKRLVASTWEDFIVNVDHAAFTPAEMVDVPDLSDLLPSEKRMEQYGTQHTI